MNRNNSNPWMYLGLVSQLAISMVTPILLMIFVCTWLKNTFSLGDWVVIAGLLLGVGSGLNSVWVYLKKFLKDGRQQQQDYDNQFK